MTETKGRRARNRRLEFDFSSVHVTFTVARAAVGSAFVPVLPFPPPAVILSVRFIHRNDTSAYSSGRAEKGAGPLELRVRISLQAWMSVSCECFVLSGRGL